MNTYLVVMSHTCKVCAFVSRLRTCLLDVWGDTLCRVLSKHFGLVCTSDPVSLLSLLLPTTPFGGGFLLTLLTILKCQTYRNHIIKCHRECTKWVTTMWCFLQKWGRRLLARTNPYNDAIPHLAPWLIQRLAWSPLCAAHQTIEHEWFGKQLSR